MEPNQIIPGMTETLQDTFWSLHLRFFLALAIAFLIGLERESASAKRPRVFAGVRTYSLLGVYGFGCAWLFHIGVAWAMPMGMLSVAVLVTIAYLAKLKEDHIGWTSEVAALMTFIIGALSLLAEVWVPMALGIIGTFLLSEKAKLESFVENLNKAEFLAVVKFLLVTIIILPILPNREFTQFKLNPRHIWQIVILVSSVGFGGYLLSKKFGSHVGLWLSGLLGGIVSSTAVTISAGRVARQSPEKTSRALQASILAGSVMYVRILALIWLVKPSFVEYLWWKLIILSIIGVLLSLRVRSGNGDVKKASVETPQNPFEIRPALVFASLFVGMSIIISLAERYYGDTGLLVVAFLTGVTDIDPFILSVVNQAGRFQAIIASAVLLAMMSNTIVKGVYFAILAGNLRSSTAWRYGLWAILHLPIILVA